MPASDKSNARLPRWWYIFVAAWLLLVNGAIVVVWLLSPPSPERPFTLVEAVAPYHCTGGVDGFALGNKDDLVAHWGVNKKLTLWNSITREMVREFSDHSDYIFEAAFNADDSLIASASVVYSPDRVKWVGSELRVRKIETGETIFACDTKVAIAALAFHPKKDVLVVGGRWDHPDLVGAEQRLMLLDIGTKKPVLYFPTDHDYVSQAVFNRDGTSLASCSYGNVEVWDVATGRVLFFVFEEDDNRTHCIRFSPDAKNVVTGHRNGMVKIRDAKTGAIINSFQGTSFAANSLDFSPDGTLLLAGGASEDLDGLYRKGEITCSLFPSGQTVFKHTGILSEVDHLAASPRGDVLLYCQARYSIISFLTPSGRFGFKKWP